MPHKAREKFKTMHNVFDNFTNRAIFKLISEGHFDGLESSIALGKEANIFSVKKGNKRLMLKIYRLEQCDFNKMYDYIKDDPRYLGLKGKKRKIIFAWVQREYRNLLKAREAGVNVPTPILFKNNILLLEFIGENDDIAPQLKSQDPKDPEKFLKDIIVNMRKMYKAGLIHADLSPFNILNFKEKPVFIDFSQTMPVKTSRSLEYLLRDIKNIVTFFKKLKIEVDKEEILNKIVK